jgi:glutamyl-tRNA synthetase
VGGARTALFNWLYARKMGGKFLLRIEDTDKARSTDESTRAIFDGLNWLGLNWDEEPVYQGLGLARHQRDANAMLASDAAYRCFCTAAELEAMRKSAHSGAEAFKYDRRCLKLDAAEVAKRVAANMPFVIRFKIPDVHGETSWDDAVHETITFPNKDIEDFVILRSDGTPIYNLAVVSDDIDMHITLVMRGDDHISNTPKQVLLYEALGQPVPQFAHVPLILGPDKKRLSKRHGATSVMEYPKLGYLPEAMVNFLALLGWNPGGDRELLDRDELISLFTLEGISGGNAVFNPEKLDWFNQQHIGRLPAQVLLARIESRLRDAGLWRDTLKMSEAAWMDAVLELLKPRVKKLDQLVDELRPFLVDEPEIDPAAAAKHLDGAVRPMLVELADRVAGSAAIEASSIEASIRGLAETRGIKAAALIHATRVSVTGRAVSAGLFDVLVLLGPLRVSRRLRRAAAYTAGA